MWFIVITPNITPFTKRNKGSVPKKRCFPQRREKRLACFKHQKPAKLPSLWGIVNLGASRCSSFEENCDVDFIEASVEGDGFVLPATHCAP